MDDFNDKLIELEEYIEENRKDGRGYYNKANFLFDYFQQTFFLSDGEMDDYVDEIYENVNRAIRNTPRLAGAFYLRGRVHLIQGKIDAAQGDFEQAVVFEPAYSEAIRELVYIYILEREYDKGLMYATRNIQNNPNSGEDYQMRALLFGLLKRTQEMEDDYQRAFDLLTDYAPIFLSRAIVAYLQGDLLESVAQVNNVIKEKISDPVYYGAKAAFMEQTGNVIGASMIRIYMLEQAVTIYTDHQSSVLYYKRGSEYLKIKHLDEAGLDFETALGYNPRNINVFYKRGILYREQKEYEKALQDFAKVITVEDRSVMANHARMHMRDIEDEVGDTVTFWDDLRRFMLG